MSQSQLRLECYGRADDVDHVPALVLQGIAQPGDDGLLRMQTGGAAEADANVRLASGVLESSNVNTIEALTTMIHLARQFETQVKLMKTAEETDAASAKLMGIS